MARSGLISLAVSLLVLLSVCCSWPVLERISSKKLCGDPECTYPILMGQTIDGHVAEDCRFLNIKRGQVVFIYLMLKSKPGKEEYWSGSVYNPDLADYSPNLGYFPKKIVNVTRHFHNATYEYPTEDYDFTCTEN